VRRHAVAAALRDASDGVLSVWNGLLSMTPEHDAVEKAHSTLPRLPVAGAARAGERWHWRAVKNPCGNQMAACDVVHVAAMCNYSTEYQF
jgi:hypothetical protein